MYLSVLLIAILALYLIIPFGTQVYGSTDQCDLPANQSCPQTSSNSQSRSEAEPEIAQTPLILPDLSPTREDLNDGQTDESATTTDSNDNDDTTSSTSTDSDNSDTTENNADDNSDDEQESGDSSEEDDDGKDSGDGPTMIPFP
jgi:hypothetical protein